MKYSLDTILGLSVLFATPASAAIYNSTTDYSIENGNPNGVWSYGWMPTDFSSFNLYADHQYIFNNCPQWGYDISGPDMWVNKTASPIEGVPAGDLTLHPGPFTQPSILRWTAPTDLTGKANINGQFLAGDSGTMLVGIRFNNSLVWSAVDSGDFKLTETVHPGDTIDFAVYGGYGAGNTPLRATIDVTAVPEPSTYLAGISALGMLGMFGWRNRK